MNSFTISQLEDFSGIKAHTIRMWEQRYNALYPQRSPGNTRHYNGLQLKRLLNIASLMNSEYKVSELCIMSDEDLHKIIQDRLNKDRIEDRSAEYFILQLVTAGIAYDEPYFDKIFASCHLRFGVKDTYIKVIYPLLVRIGQMWASDSISLSQEHFITNIIRQKLFSVIDALPPARSSDDSWVLFLPENEFHEMGLLLSHYIIRNAGKKVIYLGSNIPGETLSETIKDLSPANILTFMVHYKKPEDSQKYLDFLSKSFTHSKIHISGNEKLISNLKPGKKINWIRSVDDLEKQLLKYIS